MKPVLVTTWGPTPVKYFHSFLESAADHGLEPQNADPERWPGNTWQNIEWWRKSAAQARFVRENAANFTHFMFTDSYDIVFAAGWDEILRKFADLDSPIVFGAECYCWPDTAQAALYPPTPHRCKYLNAGFWMATSEAAVPFANELAEIAARKEKCDQGIVVDMMLSKRHPIKLDTTCSLCFCLNIDSPDFLDMSGPRISTRDTGETPALFHGNGGSDMIPVIQKLGQE